jgi:hypothetical protein
MAVCHVCKKRHVARGLNRRLAIPEYRAVIGFWPWVPVRVCDECVVAHDRDFRERMALLAPDVVENDEPVSRQVCLACAAVEAAGPWTECSKWVDAAGRPARRARFHLCPPHADLAYVDGIIVSSNLTDGRRLGAVLDELPAVGAAILERVEGWHPPSGQGPPGALDFTPDRTRAETVEAALRFWHSASDNLDAKAAWMGPVRKDYRMRYRLDLVRDTAAERRETMTVIRTAPDRFTTYRTVSAVPHA